MIFTLIPAGEGGKANTLTHPLVYLLTAGHDKEDTDIAAQLITIASDPGPSRDPTTRRRPRPWPRLVRRRPAPYSC